MATAGKSTPDNEPDDAAEARGKEVDLVWLEEDQDARDPRVERAIWRDLGVKSVTIIAREQGMTPDEVFRIKKRLFESLDVLSLEERRMKILVQMEEIANYAFEAAQHVEEERSLAGLLNSAVNAQKELLKQWRSDAGKVQQDLDSLNATRVRELVRLVKTTIDTTVPEIAREHGLDENDLFERFNRNLSLAAARIEEENEIARGFGG